MKKALVMGIMALGAVATSYGQGHIWFDNYNAAPYEPVVYGATHGANAGKGVADANVHLDLLYTIGSSSTASTDLGLSVAINPGKSALGSAGYIDGVIVNIPGYVSGPCTFQVEAWQTAGANGGATYAASGDKGISAAWQESSLATGLATANEWAGLPGPNGAALVAINTVAPEPSVFALSSIGAAALMLIRRKK